MAGKDTGSGRKGKGTGTGAEGSLVERYRTILIDRLTPEDLRELQLYLRRLFDREGHINPEYREKFRYKLRQFLHEDILTREIVSIEALIRDLRPEDLKR